MTLTSFFEAIATLAGFLFIVASMLAMGMSLTISMIVQPLKNARLVVPAPTRSPLCWSPPSSCCSS